MTEEMVNSLLWRMCGGQVAVMAPPGVYKVTGTLNFSLLFSGGLNLFPPILRHNLASRPLNIGKFCLDPPNKYFLLHF